MKKINVSIFCDEIKNTSHVSYRFPGKNRKAPTQQTGRGKGNQKMMSRNWETRTMARRAMG